jgi:putative nucleotidyltransferase-like protein
VTAASTDARPAQKTRREHRWLIDCLRAAANREPPPVPSDSFDWAALLALADAERLVPALAYACKSLDTVPTTVRPKLDQALAEATVRHVRFAADLACLLKAFDRATVPVIPLKGTALAETLYPHPAMRPATDIDLLIRRDDLERTDALLHSLGLRRLADEHSFAFDVAHDRATVYEAPSGIHIDLHWALSSEPRYAWDEASTTSVWDRAVRINVAGEAALALSPEDLLIYLAVHLAVHHALVGGLWFYDLYLLLERANATFDWDAVISRAARWRGSSAVYFVLSELERVFDAPVPRPVLAALRPFGPRAAALRWILRERTASQRPALEHTMALLLVDRGRDVAGTLGRMLLPSPAWLAARYGGETSSRRRLYGAHFRRLRAVVSEAAMALTRRR